VPAQAERGVLAAAGEHGAWTRTESGKEWSSSCGVWTCAVGPLPHPPRPGIIARNAASRDRGESGRMALDEMAVEGGPVPTPRVDDWCVAVVGMHRSGTSATAGLLVNLGLTGPRPDDLIPASSSNERGHWESKGMHRCNEGLLRAVRCARYAPPPVTLRWDGVPGYEEIRSAALRWFATTYAGGPMVAKDPRLCLTLPFWRDVLPAPIAAVFVLRDPMSVVRSLQARDEFPVTLALSIWDRYVRSASLVLEGLPTFVVEYDSMMADPSGATEQISRFLRHVGVPLEPASSGAAVSFLDSGLRHQRAELDQYEGIALSQRQVFDELSDMRGAHESWTPPLLPESPFWVDEVLGMRRDFTNRGREMRSLQTSPTHRAGAAVKRIAVRAREIPKATLRPGGARGEG
jgi:hypothetical protein